MKNLFILLIILSLAACGSTSEIQSGDTKNPDVNLSSYDNVVVLDFADSTKQSTTPALAGKSFADKIAAHLTQEAVFKKVSRVPLPEKSVVLSGAIIRYAEDNSTLRFLIGFGAGSSHFDADVKISDSGKNQELGKIVVNKQSLALGGAVASSQTPEGFMDGAAIKIAKDVAKAKNQSLTANSGQDQTVIPQGVEHFFCPTQKRCSTFPQKYAA